jgi:putative nucleotidyltransferase with HDIG domain
MSKPIHQNSIFSQGLDRTTFTAYFLGAVVPLLALAYVVQHYVLPTLPDTMTSSGILGLVSSIGVLSLGSFLVLRRAIHETLRRIDRDNRRITALLQASAALTTSEYTSDIATSTLEFATELSGTQAAYLLVCGKEDDSPAELLGTSGKHADKLFESIGERIIELADLVIPNSQPAIRNGTGNTRIPGLEAAAVLPLQGESGSIGVLAVVHSTPGARFDSAQINAITTLASLTSVAMRNAELRDSQRNFFSHMTEILITALDTHLDYHAGHGNRVAQYANRVGRAMGFDEKNLHDLHFAALLHDIGMLKIDKTLQKSAKNCEKHAVLGSRMLARIRLWEGVAPIVHSHHERYDGNGYPEGLAGNQISLEARVIGLCEAFDSMTSSTSYKAALPFEAAIEEIRNCSGSQFDPLVAEAFLDLVEQGVISE